MPPPLRALLDALGSGRTSAGELLDEALDRIDDPEGEGRRAVLHVSRETARATARAVDGLREAAVPAGPLAGIPVSIKDLFDVAGERTAAGSLVLRDVEPASRDAAAVARLRRAGAVLVGRTNMTEFAYSGVGLNPHHGTPLNPFDRATGRIPGGSTSGGAVSVTDGMAAVALGTDTGGSCRIPAALCGLTGFKPTPGRIPLEGALPLSSSHDTVGVIARTVRCVDAVDRVLAGEPAAPLVEPPLRGLRLLVPGAFLRDMDDATAGAFDRALQALSGAGAVVEERELQPLTRVPDLLRKGGIVAAEAYAWHEDLLRTRGDAYDPRVRMRILPGGEQSAAGHIRRMELRQEMIRQMERETAGFDALLSPTTPIVAPPLSAFERDEEYLRLNGLVLRNPSVANVLGRCSVSVPCHRPGEAPVGLMLTGPAGGDRRLLAVAAAVEGVLA